MKQCTFLIWCVFSAAVIAGEFTRFDALMLMTERDVVVAKAKVRNAGAINPAAVDESHRLRIKADREFETLGLETVEIEEMIYIDVSIRIRDARFFRIEDVPHMCKAWNRETRLMQQYIRSNPIPPGQCIVMLKHKHEFTGTPLELIRIFPLASEPKVVAILKHRSEMEAAADGEALDILMEMAVGQE